MIFRDLTPEEEFVVGENVYSSWHMKNLIVDGIEPHRIICNECCWTVNGLYYGICYTTYHAIEKWRKDIITNDMHRIIPTKYKPL